VQNSRDFRAAGLSVVLGSTRAGVQWTFVRSALLSNLYAQMVVVKTSPRRSILGKPESKSDGHAVKISLLRKARDKLEEAHRNAFGLMCP
jgi:hypothetical protein